MYLKRKERGFSILAVILVIVAVIVAIGVWALSGQTNTSSAGNSTADIQATSIVNDGAAIKLEFDRLILGGAGFNWIVFTPGLASTGGSPNILDPVNGLQVPKVNVNAIRVGATAPEGLWVMGYLRLLNVGIPTSPDAVIMLAGVRDSVCKEINNNLYGSTAIPAATTVTSSDRFVLGATAELPTAGTIPVLTAVTATSGWTSGCVSANSVPDNNLYFRVLYVR